MNGARGQDGRVVRCAACGHTHSAAAWGAVPTLLVLGPKDVRQHLVGWEDGAIEVRACAGCGHGLARFAAENDRPPHLPQRSWAPRSKGCP
jgi:hypothetical protein